MESNKDNPRRIKEEANNMGAWNEFWVTIRWIVVIVGIVGIIFIISQCDVDVNENPSGLDRCFNTCGQSYSGDQEVECLAKCQNIFGNPINQTK